MVPWTGVESVMPDWSDLECHYHSCRKKPASMEADHLAGIANRPVPYTARCSPRACRVFSSRVAMVIGPTPPGTGVIQAAFSFALS